MSKRLTNLIRDRICENVMHDTFSERKEHVSKLNNAAAIAVYDEIVTEEQQRIMASLPDNFFVSECTIRCRVKRRGDSYDSHRLTLAIPKLFPAFLDKMFYDFEIIKGQAALDAIAVYDAAVTALDTDKSVTRSKISATLTALTTDVKLLETWPEVEKYVPWDMFPASKNLTVDIKGLNAQIACSKVGDCQ